MRVDHQRFTALYHDTYRTVHAYVYRRLPPDDVADVVAETYLAAWRRLDTVPVADPVPWLLATARNLVMTAWRTRRHRTALTVALAELTPVATEPDVAERLAVFHAVARLSAADRDLLLASAWDGLSTGQIAAVLGCSYNAAAMRLHRARTRLADALQTVTVEGVTP
ncbi:RNA polymerase sigma factor [Longimycelium tulufanense]|uniref:RNA polymerase sigma factor n=1 Tax=Longimycelium tulufanense TaxID=907463 RepID=UPI0016654761|nr:sigma-70 family RNA polymerase sigma factor [Longimycelium tulufanense]